MNLREEVPHGIGVEIEKIEEFEDLTEVQALIICERDSHKGIIIGKKGSNAQTHCNGSTVGSGAPFWNKSIFAGVCKGKRRLEKFRAYVERTWL